MLIIVEKETPPTFEKHGTSGRSNGAVKLTSEQEQGRALG